MTESKWGLLVFICTARAFVQKLRRLLANRHVRGLSTVAMVKLSTEAVVREAAHVSLSRQAISKFVSQLSKQECAAMMHHSAFDDTIHFVDGTWKTVQYFLVLDALNFCFWPVNSLGYTSLSVGLRNYILQNGIESLSASALQQCTASTVQQMFEFDQTVPLVEERARLLREVGTVLLTSFDGQAANLVKKARGSAVKLVCLVASSFPGFRDQAVYRGKQVFLYKRAQIFVADVYGAFQGKGLGNFHDIGELTMFADYMVPVALKDLGIISFSPRLAEQVSLHSFQTAVSNQFQPRTKSVINVSAFSTSSKKVLKMQLKSLSEIPPGSEEEIELRAVTIQAVELMRKKIKDKFGAENTPISIQLDWWLWTTAERMKTRSIPHHRTLTVFY